MVPPGALRDSILSIGTALMESRRGGSHHSPGVEARALYRLIVHSRTIEGIKRRRCMRKDTAVDGEPT
jgi:hypothetical protein